MSAAALRNGVVLVFLVASVACRTASQSTTHVTPVRDDDAPRVRQADHLVGAAEIRAAGVHTAFEAIRRLRPDLLARRATSASDDPYRGAPVVYVNRVRQGELEMLQSVPASVIVDIRYLPVVAANDWVGAYHPGGVILVRTRQ